MALGTSFVLVTFLFLACRPLYHIFTTDQKVIDTGVWMLRLIVPSYMLFVFIEILSGSLRGIGDVIIPTLITLGGVCLVRVPMALILTPMTGEVSTLIYSYPVSWGVTILLLIPYFFYIKKKKLSE